MQQGFRKGTEGIRMLVQGLYNYRGLSKGGRVYRAIFENAISSLFLSSTCTLSADPQFLCIFSLLLLLALLLVATPRNWLNASVVRFTRTFSEPIRRKPRSFSACSINHRVTTWRNHRSW